MLHPEFIRNYHRLCPHTMDQWSWTSQHGDYECGFIVGDESEHAPDDVVGQADSDSDSSTICRDEGDASWIEGIEGRVRVAATHTRCTLKHTI